MRSSRSGNSGFQMRMPQTMAMTVNARMTGARLSRLNCTLLD